VPLNRSLTGKEYGEVRFVVDRDRALQFSDAVGEDRPVFRDPGPARLAGYADQVTPPTFPTVMQIMTSGQVVVDQELGLNYALVVHGEQEYAWHRPIVVGDRLSTVPRIAEIYSRGPNEYLVIEAEIKDDSGESVVVSRTTLLSRGTAGG
jgi:acyl dehydratase